MQPDIKFLDLPSFAPDKVDLENWLIECSALYKVIINEFYVNFVGADALLKINQAHLSHDTHTDIITFSYEAPPTLSAEVFISLPMLKDNASQYDVSPENEALRLISHGFLHAMGYRDKTKNDKDTMTQEENVCLSMFHVKHQGHV